MTSLISDEMIHEALTELQTKGENGIERETELKWGARYVAAKMLNKSDATQFYHEALEHAASTKDVGFYYKILKELENFY
jgi:rubrerythrin